MGAPDDSEWTELADAWRAGTESRLHSGTPAEIRAGVERAGRRQRVRTLLEGAAALAAVLVLLHLARVHPTRAAERWAALGIANLALLWAAILLNRLGTWRPLAATTQGFLDLSVLRARRSRRAATGIALCLGLELAGLTAWLWREGLLTAAVSREEWVFRLVVLGATLAGIAGALLRRRSAGAELRMLERLRAESPDLGGER